MWSDAAPVAPLMRVALKKAKMTAMSTGRLVTALKALAFGVLALGCGSSGGGGTGGGTGGAGAGGHGGGAALTTTETVTIDRKTGAGDCLTGTLQLDSQSQPNCTVTAEFADGGTNSATYSNCVESNATIPCWMLVAGGASCVGQSLTAIDDPNAPPSSYTVSCQVCEQTAGANGCPCVQTVGAVNGPTCIR
jgi:hypothetical protein